MQPERVREMIDSAGERELSDIILRLIKRYGELFPEEEIIFLSLPKNDQKEQVRILGELLLRAKNSE